MNTNLTGLSIADTQHPIETYQQLGGPGRVLNKALAIPGHLGAPWHSIEFVLLPPGHNGIGTHCQTTDEIYLILSGQGQLITHGETALVEAGMVCGAPVGTVHALTNVSATADLTVLVVELDAPEHASVYPPSWCHLLRELHESEAFHPVVHGAQRCVRPRLATVDLRQTFAAAWGSLSLVEIPPGCRVPLYCEPEHDQLLLVVKGYATFTIPGATPEEEPLRVFSTSRSHQSVLVPRGVFCSWTNRASGNYPLLVACLTVRPHRSASSTEGGV